MKMRIQKVILIVLAFFITLISNAQTLNDSSDEEIYFGVI